MLTREQILGIDDFKIQLVEVPEWKGQVFVKTMSANERDRFEESFVDKKLTGARAKMVALTCCDEKAELLFTEQDIEVLGKKSASALEKICSASMNINKLTNEDIEGVEKN